MFAISNSIMSIKQQVAKKKIICICSHNYFLTWLTIRRILFHLPTHMSRR